jgi:hypothetical protein
MMAHAAAGSLTSPEDPTGSDFVSFPEHVVSEGKAANREL